MLQHSVARKKKQGAAAQPHEEEGDRQLPSPSSWSCAVARLRAVRGAALQRNSELFVELRCNATPSCSWSCAATRLRAVRGAALQRSSQLFVELRCSAAPSCSWSCAAAQLPAVRGAALQRSSKLFVELRCNAVLNSAPSSAQL
jgi:hypothetical protein